MCFLPGGAGVEGHGAEEVALAVADEPDLVDRGDVPVAVDGHQRLGEIAGLVKRLVILEVVDEPQQRAVRSLRWHVELRDVDTGELGLEVRSVGYILAQ